MIRLIQPPDPIVIPEGKTSIFLAGSIEMGEAEDWQSFVISKLQDLNIVVLNPRRDAWNSSWIQSIKNPLFREQVEWELSGQEKSDMIAMYFAPATKAPITLLELGLFAPSKKVIVCCPENFWRRGNVEIVCAKYKIPLISDLESLIEKVKKKCRMKRKNANKKR